jgi:uncharacterized protein DUF3891
MIIRPDGDSLLFITQPDHARLAAELLAQWRDDEFSAHPRRDTLLLAAREHDNGWREPDAAMVFDTARGAGLDFLSAPDEVKQAVWPRGVDRLSEISPYAAALVAQHALYVLRANRDKPSWRDFFDRVSGRRDSQLQCSGMSAADLDSDYRFLSIVDLLSLAFCNGWREDEERFACAAWCDGNTLLVKPAMLREAAVPLRVRARRLENRPYASASELRAAFENAPLELLEGQARGVSP